MASIFLTFLMFPSPFAKDILYQGDVQGGISVDGSGVATNTGSTTSWLSGPDIQVQIPATATITEVYAVVTPKASGFLTNINSAVRINGVDLTSATLLTGTTVEVDRSTGVACTTISTFVAMKLATAPSISTGNWTFSFDDGHSRMQR